MKVQSTTVGMYKIRFTQIVLHNICVKRIILLNGPPFRNGSFYTTDPCTSVYFAKGSLKFTRQHVMNTIWDKRGVKLKGTMPDMIRYFFILFSGLLNIHTCCGIALGGKLRGGGVTISFTLASHQTSLTQSSSISVSSTFNLTLNNFQLLL